jgi:HK97 family phage major capsid protein
MEDSKETLDAINKVGKQVEEFKTKLGEKADKGEFKTQFEAIETSMKGLTANVEKIEKEKLGETLKAIQTQMTEMAEDVARVKENGNKPSANKSFGAVVIDAIKAAGLHEKKSWSKNEHQSVEVKYDFAGIMQKASANMGTGNVTPVGTDSIAFSLAEYESGLTRIVRRRPWILNIANVSRTNKKYVQWAEQANPDGTTDYTAEGAAKNKIDFDWVEKSAEVLKVTAYIKVSKEALEDLDGLQNEINMELTEQILLKVDAELLSGAGTSGILKGILSGDTAWAAGSFATSIPNANKSDVLRTAIAQVVANEFVPDYALLHPNDIASMELEKGSDGHYVLPPFRSADGTLISGVKVIGNTGQTVDKFTVGDFTKFNVKMRDDMMIDIGLDADDFTKNLRTILGEIRLVSYIKTNHAGAFVSGDFSDAITAINLV